MAINKDRIGKWQSWSTIGITVGHYLVKKKRKSHILQFVVNLFRQRLFLLATAKAAAAEDGLDAVKHT